MQKLSKEKLQELKGKIYEDFRSYILWMCPEYIFNWHHEVMIKNLQLVADGKLKKLMIFLPPRHGKSFLASQLFPPFLMGRKPNTKVMSCGYSDDFVSIFGKATRRIVQDEKFRWAFDTKLGKESKAVSYWSLENQSTYMAAGTNGGVTGKGANFLLMDDLIKGAAVAKSLTMRDSIWDFYENDATTRLEGEKAQVLIMTRWHEDDVAGRLLAREPNEWKVLKLPALATYDTKNRSKGEALWPMKMNRLELEDVKKKSPITFSCLYQQDPISEEISMFKRSWFQKWRELPQLINVITTVDPAISKKKKACDSCVLTAGMDQHGKIYVLEYKNAKLDPTELIDEMFRQAGVWKSKKVYIEGFNYQQSLLHFCSLRMKESGERVNFANFEDRRAKEDRIEDLIPYYKLGDVFHPHDSEELEKQLLKFPRGKMKDIIDTLAMQIVVQKKPINPAVTSSANLPRINYDPRTGRVLGIAKPRSNIFTTR